MISGNVAACCAGLYELPLTRVLLGSSFHPGGLELSERLASAVALGPTDCVLDVASGRGDTALHLARKYGAQVVGVDYSAAQVDEANERAAAEGLQKRSRFVHGDAGFLPFEDGAFDVVFCECALCTFPSRPQAVAEIKRVLAPGGSFALSDIVLNRPAPPELSTMIGYVMCIGGALSRGGYEQSLLEGGFSGIRHRDASGTLTQLIDQIEARLARLTNLSEDKILEGTELSQTEVRDAFAVAREFVSSGGLGYATFTARA